MHTCDDCSNSFFVPGQSQPMVISGGCPECGGHLRPERDQPGGTASDGTYRDDFKQDGNGHNPLMEGILGDYQPSLKRDESFASVRASDYNFDAPAGVKIDMSLTASNQHPQMPWTHSEEEVPSRVHVGGPLLALPAAAELAGGALAGGEAAGAAAGAGEAAAAGAGAGEAAGGGGFLGGISNMMNGAMSAGPMKALQGAYFGTGVMNHMNGESGDGSAGPTGAPQQEPVHDYLSATHTALDLPGGGTPGDSTKNQEKPDEVDPKEHEDSPENLNDVISEGAGSDAPKDFDPHGAGVERFMMLMPLVKHYAEGEEDGSEDPLIKALHEILEAEVPGYLNHAEGNKDGHSPESEHEHSDEDQSDFTDGLEKESDPADHESKTAGPIAPPAAPMAAPSAIGLTPCAQCGAMMPPAAATCPQCGAQSGTGMHNGHTAAPLGVLGPQAQEADLQSANWPPHSAPVICPGCHSPVEPQLGGCPHCGTQLQEFSSPHMGASHQGPHSPEQVAAVQQLLIDAGRVQEVPNVPIHPWEYADEMAQLSQSEAPPSQDVTAQPPMPAQEETPQDANMPVPGMSMPPGQSSVTAADNAAPICPKCDSHTTGTDDDEGNCSCHTCGHRWKVSDTLVESRVVASHRWATTDGQQLEAEQTYELHTPNVSIPDIVKVQAVKPDGITLEFTGAHNMSFTKEVTAQEAQLEGYSFTSVRGLDKHNTAPLTQDQNPQADYDPQSFSGSGTDDTHQVMTSWNLIGDNPPVPTEQPQGKRTIASMIAERRASAPVDPQEAELNLNDHPDRNWLFGDDTQKTAGAKFSPSEQRDLIDEDGIARNADKMDLANTHYQRHTTVSDLDMVIGW